MKRLAVLVLVGLAIGASPAKAGEKDDAVAAFVKAVYGGEELAAFQLSLSERDAADLKNLAGCKAGDPGFGDGGSAVVVWDCWDQGKSSKATMLSFKDGKIDSVFLMPAVIVPVEEQVSP
jgi:hypothetical protein